MQLVSTSTLMKAFLTVQFPHGLGRSGVMGFPAMNGLSGLNTNPTVRGTGQQSICMSVAYGLLFLIWHVLAASVSACSMTA